MASLRFVSGSACHVYSHHAVELCDSVRQRLTHDKEPRFEEHIGLGQTGLGDEECRVLQAALAVNSGSLIFISLGRNQITSKGAAALAQGLEKNTGVQLVNLSYNEIDEDGTAAIARCVQVHEHSGTALQTVWVAGNKSDPSNCVGCIVNSAFFYSDILSAMEKYI